MSEKFWEDVLSEIDDKFVEEAAEADVTKLSETVDDAAFTEPVVAAKKKTPKRKIAMFSALGGLAAAIAIAVPIALNANLFNLTGTPEETTIIEGGITEPYTLENATLPYPESNDDYWIDSYYYGLDWEMLPYCDDHNEYQEKRNQPYEGLNKIFLQAVKTDNYIIRIEIQNPYALTGLSQAFSRHYTIGDIYLSLYDLDNNLLDTILLKDASDGYYFETNTAPELYVWDIDGGLLVAPMQDWTIMLNSENDYHVASFYTILNDKFAYFESEEINTFRPTSHNFKVVGNSFIDIDEGWKYTFTFEGNDTALSDLNEPVREPLPSIENTYGIGAENAPVAYGGSEEVSDVTVVWDSVQMESYKITLETESTWKESYDGQEMYSGLMYANLYDNNGNFLNKIAINVNTATSYKFTKENAPKLYAYDELALVAVVLDNSPDDEKTVAFFSTFNSNLWEFTKFNSDNEKLLPITTNGSFEFRGNSFIDIGNNKMYQFDYTRGSVKIFNTTGENAIPTETITKYETAFPNYLLGTITKTEGDIDSESYQKYFAGSRNLVAYNSASMATYKSTVAYPDSPASFPEYCHMASDGTGVWYCDAEYLYYVPYNNPTQMFCYYIYARNWKDDTANKNSFNAVYQEQAVPTIALDTDTELLKSTFSGEWEQVLVYDVQKSTITLGETFGEKQLGLLKLKSGTLLVLSSGSGYYVPDDEKNLMYYYTGLPADITEDFDITTILLSSILKRSASDSTETFSSDAIEPDFDTIESVFFGQWKSLTERCDDITLDYSSGSLLSRHIIGLFKGEYGWIFEEFNGGCGSYYYISYDEPDIMYYFPDMSPEFTNDDGTITFDRLQFMSVYKKTSDEYQTEYLDTFGFQVLLGEKDNSILYDMWSQPEAVLSSGEIYQRVYPYNENMASCTVEKRIRLVSREENRMVFAQPFYRPLTFKASIGEEDAYDFKTLNVTIEKDENGDWWVTDVVEPVDGALPDYRGTLEQGVKAYLALDENWSVSVDEAATNTMRAEIIANDALKLKMNWNDEFINKCFYVVNINNNGSSASYYVIEDPTFNKWYVLPDGWDNTASTTGMEIKTDLLSEIGMSYSELAEKYGEATGGTGNVRSFENGYGGRYYWDETKVTDGDVSDAGGLIGIDGILPEALFKGITLPIRFEELESAYGFKFDTISDEATMDDCYWSSFTYGDKKITVFTSEHGILSSGVGNGCIVEASE